MREREERERKEKEKGIWSYYLKKIDFYNIVIYFKLVFK